MKPGTGQQVDRAAKKVSDIALDAKKLNENQTLQNCNR